MPTDAWCAQVNYVYNDAVHVNKSKNPPGECAVSHKLDVTFSRRLGRDKQTELMLGVTDILKKTNSPVYDIASFTAYETPGRSLFIRLSHAF